MAAVAREVIEAYGDASGWAMANPVGTGPYRLKEWRRGQQIVLEANPNYREEYFPALPATPTPTRDAVRGAMKGKRLPQVGRIEIVGHRGVESAAARVQQRRARLRQRAADLVRQRARRERHAAAALREARA